MNNKFHKSYWRKAHGALRGCCGYVVRISVGRQWFRGKSGENASSMQF